MNQTPKKHLKEIDSNQQNSSSLESTTRISPIRTKNDANRSKYTNLGFTSPVVTLDNGEK